MKPKIGLILVCCWAISGCAASKVESSPSPSFTPAPQKVVAPLESASEDESATPPMGFYLCKTAVYQDSEYSFTLFPDGRYIKQDSQAEGIYSYSISEDGLVFIQWQGMYAPWNTSVYTENEGKKIILLSGSNESIPSQKCQWQAN